MPEKVISSFPEKESFRAQIKLMISFFFWLCLFYRSSCPNSFPSNDKYAASAFYC
jgi:hypothetical protein